MPKVTFDTYGDRKEDTFEEKKHSSLWDKTKGWFKKQAEKKEEDNKFKEEIRSEALKEAKVEVVPILQKQYKQQEIDRLTGKNKGDLMEKFKNSLSGANGSFIASDEKLDRMLGKKKVNVDSSSKEESSTGGLASNDKLMGMLGKNKDKIKEENHTKGVSNDDIMNMMSTSSGKHSNKNAVDEDKIKRGLKIKEDKENSKVVDNDKISSMLGKSGSNSSTQDKLDRMLGKKK